MKHRFADAEEPATDIELSRHLNVIGRLFPHVLAPFDPLNGSIRAHEIAAVKCDHIARLDQPDAATDRIAPGQELEQLQIDGVDLISEFIKLGFGHFA